jgi:hypothetical protein
MTKWQGCFMVYNFKKPDRFVDTIFLHCSATDNPEHDNKEFIRKIHVDQNGWKDIGYHYFINKAGQVTPCRPLERNPAAQRGHNTGSIAICLSGLEKDKFTENQFLSLIDLVYTIQQEYNERLRIRGHREVANKSCPVFDYVSILNLTERGYLRERRKSVKDSRAVKGSSLAGGAIVATQVIPSLDLPNLAQQVTASTTIASGLSKILEVSPYVLTAIALIGIGYVIYARIQDHKDAIR